MAPDQVLTSIPLLETDRTSIQVSKPVETFEYEEAAAMGEPDGTAL